MLRRLTLPSVAAASLAVVLLWQTAPRAAQPFGWSRFDQYVESLRTQARIPGLSAVIIKDGEVVWDRGFGFQDVEALVRATSDTPYHVVGLTQVVSASLLLDCVERGRAALDTPARTYAPDGFPDTAVTLQHLLTHSSTAEPPGSAFQFDLQRYAALTPAIERCWNRRVYRELVKTEILNRLAMFDSVPGADVLDPEVLQQLPSETYDQDRINTYAALLSRLAKPYKTDKPRPVAVEYPSKSFDAASGLVTTVRDLAKFDVSLGEFLFLDEETLQNMWTPPMPVAPPGLPSAGAVAPMVHGLGWFVQTYQGQKVVWQFGQWPGVTSALYMKVPEKGLTFIILANGDGLAPAGSLALGDVTVSAFAKLFLKYFV